MTVWFQNKRTRSHKTLKRGQAQPSDSISAKPISNGHMSDTKETLSAEIHCSTEAQLGHNQYPFSFSFDDSLSQFIDSDESISTHFAEPELSFDLDLSQLGFSDDFWNQGFAMASQDLDVQGLPCFLPEHKSQTVHEEHTNFSLNQLFLPDVFQCNDVPTDTQGWKSFQYQSSTHQPSLIC